VLKKKVIASSINNLTDARYFAGWMVDYIIFHTDPKHPNYTNPQEIGTFQSWVEGPQYFFDLADDQFEQLEKILVDLGGHGVSLPYNKRSLIASSDVQAIMHMSLETFTEGVRTNTLQAINSIVVIENVADIYSLIEKVESLKSSSEYEGEIFVELPQNPISEDWVLNPVIDGFLMHGSPEEKVGFKSFDELDDIFEILQDF